MYQESFYASKELTSYHLGPQFALFGENFQPKRYKVLFLQDELFCEGTTVYDLWRDF